MSKVLYPFINEILFDPLKVIYTKYCVSINYKESAPMSFGLWGFISTTNSNDGVWFRIKEYFRPYSNDDEQRNILMAYSELMELIGDLKNVSLLFDPNDVLSSKLANMVSDKWNFKLIKFSGNTENYYSKICQALQSGIIKISSNCYDMQREHIKCTLDNPMGDNGIMSEIGLFIDYNYSFPNKNNF